MSNLPVLHMTREPTSRRLVQAAEAQRSTELEIFKYALEARYVAECERIDAQALGDVVRASAEEEMSLFDWGMEQASGSAIKAELVARKVTMLSSMNNARLMRRFGMQ